VQLELHYFCRQSRVLLAASGEAARVVDVPWRGRACWSGVSRFRSTVSRSKKQTWPGVRVIINLETLRFEPRAGEVVANAYAAALDEIRGPASLIGYWNVEIGQLNTARLLWGFGDASESDASGIAAVAPHWPASLDGIVTASESLVLEPAPFNGEIEPGTYGPIYEIRIYDYERGSVRTVIDRWADMVLERRAISCLIGCYSSTGGDVDKWVHIWAYRDGRERELARVEASRRKIWPPETGEWLLHQENMIVVPAPCSPLR
jgi:hypothetical protein